MKFDISHPAIRDVVERALAEDIGSGDITSELTVPGELQASGTFLAKQDLTLAGVDLLTLIYSSRGGAEVSLSKASGSSVVTGEQIAAVSGRARALLACERVALNFLQRLSGIATLARKYVDAVTGTNVQILDTRKTTPGLRVLEKMAAAAGGVTNHRHGLFDAVLIKNNHIRLAGGVRAAIERARSLNKPIEIETRAHAEIEEALACGAARLLLDNMTPEQAAAEIEFIGRRAETEISGGVTLENVRAYAEARPDFISSGAITHSAAAVDINCGIYAI